LNTKISWEEVEVLLAERSSVNLTWKLYNDLPRSRKIIVQEQSLKSIKLGLETGLMQDWQVVLEAAVVASDLQDAVIDALKDSPVKGIMDNGTEIKGSICYVDLEGNSVVVYPNDIQFDVTPLKLHQLEFLECNPTVEVEETLSFSQAWTLYEIGETIESIVSGIHYHRDFEI